MPETQRKGKQLESSLVEHKNILFVERLIGLCTLTVVHAYTPDTYSCFLHWIAIFRLLGEKTFGLKDKFDYISV